MFESPERVLVVAAHPDDEVLLCGGSIAKLSERGSSVNILFLSTGAVSRTGDFSEVNILQNYAIEASKILGSSILSFDSFPDNEMDSLPRLDIIKKVESFINHVRPQVIFTHYPGCANIDHRRTCEAVMIATRPWKERINVFGGSVLSSTAVLYPSEWSPQFFVHLSKSHVKKKLKALSMYISETGPMPHPRSKAAVLSDAILTGSRCYSKYAESFMVLREHW